jgi:hypothetical protein
MRHISPRKVAPLLAVAAALATGCTGIVRVTTTTSDGPANRASQSLALNGDGTLVAFLSEATNLVPNDTNNVGDIIVRDRTKRTVERVSVATRGVQANGSSVAPEISDDGRFVVFVSTATNLGSGEQGETAPDGDVFVHDRSTRVTRLLSRLPDGTHPTALDAVLLDLSADGRTVLFSIRDDPAALVYRVVVATGAVSIEVPRSECPPDTNVGAAAALSADGTKGAVRNRMLRPLAATAVDRARRPQGSVDGRVADALALRLRARAVRHRHRGLDVGRSCRHRGCLGDREGDRTDHERLLRIPLAREQPATAAAHR